FVSPCGCHDQAPRFRSSDDDLAFTPPSAEPQSSAARRPQPPEPAGPAPPPDGHPGNPGGRTLLSTVVTSISNHELYITTAGGTAQNVSFSITENNTTGQITLVGTPAPNPTNPHLPSLPSTQINGLPVGMA